MSNNDYMQTCNMDERTNEDKLSELINFLRRRTADEKETSAANAIAFLLGAVESLKEESDGYFLALTETNQTITTLQRQLAEANNAKMHIIQQAEIQAQEARTQRSIVLSIGELIGCKNDWQMCEAVANYIAAQRGEIEKLREQLVNNNNWLSIFETRRKPTDNDLRIIERLRADNDAALTEGGE